MSPLGYQAAMDAAAIAGAARGAAEYIAGGTDLIQLLQERVRAPGALIDINGLPHRGVVAAEDGGLRIGALTRLAEVAEDGHVRERYPLLAEALLATASPQVRNMATIGGNLLQRTRCLSTPRSASAPTSSCASPSAPSGTAG
jgi:xanthine dehydrogenase YagS FAD-binding subunit